MPLRSEGTTQLPHQIRTLSTLRLLAKIGTLRDAKARAEVEEKVLDHLGIELDDE